MLRYYLTGLKKIFSVAKKAFIIFVVFSAVIALFSFFINKDKVSLTSQISQISQKEKNRADIYEVINDKKLGSTKEGKIIIALYRFTMCGMIGEACTNNPKDGDINSQKSVFGFISKLIVTPFANPPASGVTWAYSGLQNAGFVPKTLAAEGVGFAAIKPFSNLWKIFRDVSYMLLVIILIAIGFMVMFRAKLNPQTVMTVENALPKIVISLILITFSFAIAGFLIDIMYVLIILIISILSSNGNNFNAVNYQNEYLGANMMHIFKDVAGRSSLGSIIPIIGDSVLGILDSTVVFGFRSLVGIVTTIILNNSLFHIIGGSISTSLNDITVLGVGLGDIPGLVLTTPIALALFVIIFYVGSTAVFTLAWWILIGGTVVFVAFRIIGLLFSSYIKLILMIIISPLLLLFESIPGKSTFSYWVKNIIGFLLPFPVTIAVSLIGYIIINSTTPAGYADVRLPYLFGINSNAFKILIGMGLIFIIPDLVKLLKEALGIKEIPPLIGISTFFGGATAVGGAAMGGIGQFGSLSLALGAFTGTGILGNTGIGKSVQGWLHLPKSGKGVPEDPQPPK